MTSSTASTPHLRGPGTPVLGLSANAHSPRPAGQVSSAADLTASVRRTSGQRPPPLVGSSVTVIGDAAFVFGGRLVPSRTMVGTLYRLDLPSGEWTRLWPAEGVERPAARYAHLGAVTSVAVEGRDKAVLVIMGGQDVRNTCASRSLLPSSSA